MSAVSMIWLGHFFLTTRLFCNHLLIGKITVQSNNKDCKSIQHSRKHLRWKTFQQYLKSVKIVQSALSKIILAVLDTFLKALTIFIYFALESLYLAGITQYTHYVISMSICLIDVETTSCIY